MDVIIGSARIDENGKIAGGKAGDQKQSTTPDFKGEVSMQKMYVPSKGWYVLRPKNPQIALKIGSYMIAACNNRNLGYNQARRAEVLKYGTSSKVSANCDCSSLVRQCIKEASGIDVGNFTTLDEAQVLEKSGLFKKKISYTKTTILYTGDILVTKTKGHTAAVTAGHARTDAVKYFKAYPKEAPNTTSIVEALNYIGENSSFENRKKIAQANNISDYVGDIHQNTLLLNSLKSGTLIKP